MSNASYVFVFNGSSNWRLSDEDNWDLDIVSLDGSEKVLGHRQIDGAIVKVLQDKSGKIIALSK